MEIGDLVKLEENMQSSLKIISELKNKVSDVIAGDYYVCMLGWIVDMLYVLHV